MRILLFILTAVVACASVFALVEMKGQLKGFAGTRGNIGANKVSVVSKLTPTTHAPQAPKPNIYTRPIPSAYRFDALKNGISGRPGKFSSRFQI
ncbi:hypothetical protein HY641_00805 [Candidatus Woesearchaeota archaeon]|nr:hypothetical protein [Candidatus Woesearchaeota archaeon]